MAIPDYEKMMLPILEFLSDGQIHKTSEIVSGMATKFDLSPEDMKELLPSGRSKTVNNRVGWACTYLRKAGLIESPQRAYSRIKNIGMEVLRQNHGQINNQFLQQFEGFRSFRESNSSSNSVHVNEPENQDEKTPHEIIGEQSNLINSSLSNDLLEQIASMTPDRFEQLVVDLLLAMGYGGTAEDAGRAIGQSNDGGVDGVVMEDPLGLDTIYIQAKKWQNTVPVREVRDFAGALMSKRSNRGVFITTSSFPLSAQEFVGSIDKKIILIDGKRLAGLMIKYNLGVAITQTIEIKELDTDYFTF